MAASPPSRNQPNNARPSAPGAKEQYNRLKELLRRMFQLDRGDLDFGLYRVMNMKAKDVDAFLDKDLLPQVQAVLGAAATERHAAVEKELKEAESVAWRQAGDPEVSLAVAELKKRLAAARADAAAEADVYNHLVIFFSRYYSEGDFVSQRRYSGSGESAYLIPYDGEEVKLHWANADQYYIKTTENYASYIFTVDAAMRRRARFEIAAANNEKDNVKPANGKQRRFVLAGGEDAVAIDGNDLVVRFEHRPLTESEGKRWPVSRNGNGNGNGGGQQGRINADAVKKIMDSTVLDSDWKTLLAAPAPTEANGERTVLAKHVERYTAKNAFDYFIHKDLQKFLRRELDLYLNTEVLNLDELEHGDVFATDRALARVRAIRHIARKIIDFLAQLENFQKQLWLKKKFVLESHWCVTLDRVPEALYSEAAANEKQREEWVKLLAIDEIKGDLGNGNAGYAAPLSVEFLKANPFLALDTRHFDRDFTERLLGALSDSGPLDEQMNGLLIHGENFQALNLLQARYHGQVECVYIDPPYNTGDSEILYKNSYLHSSWLTLMENRLNLAMRLLTNDPLLFVAIDDFEMVDLSELIDEHFSFLRREMIIVNHHPQGGKSKLLANTHEYMLTCVHHGSERILAGRKSGDGVELRPFKRSGTAESNFRSGRPNSFYAVLVDPDSKKVVGIEAPPGDHSVPYPTGNTKEGFVRIYPLSGNPADLPERRERVWRRSYDSCPALVEAKQLKCSDNLTIYQTIRAEDRTAALFSNWVDPRYNAGTFGANLLRDIIGEHNPFSYPKSIHTVGDALSIAEIEDHAYCLDYFAGSGTTGHAVINLNREDGGNRKYILTEMADHFDAVLLPRIKKVVHSLDWKEGKPVSRDGCSQVFKYIRLESYEDTLDGLEWTPPQDDLLTQDAESNAELLEDYRLRYALGEETATSACLLGQRFLDPFAYTLSVVRDCIRREVHVDLPETFNYLLGLRVASRRRIDGVLTIAGADAAGRSCLVLWRNQEQTDHAALNKWFTDNRQKLPASLDVVYVNGDHPLDALKPQEESWVAETIEPAFRKMMFEATDDE